MIRSNGPVRGVQQFRERFAGLVGEQAEDADEDQERADDQIAEQRMEQQLPVVLGPIRWQAQVRGIASSIAGGSLRAAADSMSGGHVLVACRFLADHRSGSQGDGDRYHDERRGLCGSTGRWPAGKSCQHSAGRRSSGPADEGGLESGNVRTREGAALADVPGA